jgi:transposase
VARLCAVLPIKQVAAFFGLSWSTVKAIDKRYLEAALGPVELRGVQVIAMDEFAIQKGHRYAPVIIDPSVKQVLWVGRGRSRDAIRPFFERLGQEGRTALKAVAMDMNAAYEEEVRHQCPKAEIVYDLFHVVAKYGREVIDRVRVDEANRLKGDLKEPWRLRDRNQARTAWENWVSRAIESGIAPLIAFANKLQKYLDGILSHCRWPLHTSLLEGFNNKIKLIKRMAYGFRDDHYFFLKIRAAFQGIL